LKHFAEAKMSMKQSTFCKSWYYCLIQTQL